MKTIGYLRVSSKAQNVEMQRSAIDRAAAARGHNIQEWYVEKRSAKTLARPELDRLRSDLRTGLVKRVYVFKLDRLTRTGVGDTYKLIDEMKAAGAEVIATADNLHLKPGAEDVVTDVFLFALGLAAKLERTAINDRISAARDRMESQGKAWGRPSRLTDEDREKIVSLKNEGRSIRQISVALKVPRATVGRALAAANFSSAS